MGGITNSTDMSFSKLQEMVKDWEACCVHPPHSQGPQLGSEKFTGPETTMKKSTTLPGTSASDPLGEARVKGKKV